VGLDRAVREMRTAMGLWILNPLWLPRLSHLVRQEAGGRRQEGLREKGSGMTCSRKLWLLNQKATRKEQRFYEYGD
jgi:hypothetical protein